MSAEFDRKFESIWQWMKERKCTYVQDHDELKHICKLAQECNSYLEIGSAEGNSLFAIGNFLNPHSTIVSVDWGEKHTDQYRAEVIKKLREMNHIVVEIIGDSHDAKTLESVLAQQSTYDLVMIDAGHETYDVMADCQFYSELANKYIAYHDIELQPVRKFWDWKTKHDKYSALEHYEFVTPGSPYGFGVVKRND